MSEENEMFEENKSSHAVSMIVALFGIFIFFIMMLYVVSGINELSSNVSGLSYRLGEIQKTIDKH